MSALTHQHTVLSPTTTSEVARFCTMTAAMAKSSELKDEDSSVATSRAPGCSSSASWVGKKFPVTETMAVFVVVLALP